MRTRGLTRKSRGRNNHTEGSKLKPNAGVNYALNIGGSDDFGDLLLRELKTVLGEPGSAHIGKVNIAFNIVT